MALLSRDIPVPLGACIGVAMERVQMYPRVWVRRECGAEAAVGSESVSAESETRSI